MNIKQGFGITGILIGIIIAIVVGVGAVYVVKNTDLITKDVDDTIFIDEIQEGDELITADWKIYSNFDDGYEIRYPADWTVNDSYKIPAHENVDGQVWFISPEKTQYLSDNPDSEIRVSDISITTIYTDKSLDEYLKLLDKPLETLETERHTKINKVNFGGVAGYEIVPEDRESSIFLKYADSIYKIGFSISDSPTGELLQITESIKFLN